MDIQADKFLALTAMLAGFVPAAACTLNIGGGTATESAGTEASTDTGSGGGTTVDDPTGGTTGGTTGATEAMTSAPTSSTGGTEEPPTSGTSDGTSADSTGGTTGGAMGDCCEAHQTPGCSEMTISECVCAQDPLCCGFEDGFWDDICVQEVNDLGCGMCDLGDTTTA